MDSCMLEQPERLTLGTVFLSNGHLLSHSLQIKRSWGLQEGSGLLMRYGSLHRMGCKTSPESPLLCRMQWGQRTVVALMPFSEGASLDFGLLSNNPNSVLLSGWLGPEQAPGVLGSAKGMVLHASWSQLGVLTRDITAGAHLAGCFQRKGDLFLAAVALCIGFGERPDLEGYKDKIQEQFPWQ